MIIWPSDTTSENDPVGGVEVLNHHFTAEFALMYESVMVVEFAVEPQVVVFTCF